jgi:hypothetical protein
MIIENIHSLLVALIASLSEFRPHPQRRRTPQRRAARVANWRKAALDGGLQRVEVSAEHDQLHAVRRVVVRVKAQQLGANVNVRRPESDERAR